MHGKRDGLAPYRVATEMHARIEGSKMITFGGGHHFLFIRYKQFVQAVLDFLDSLRTSKPDRS
ncbi:MAG: alpha/beta hydrolase [Dehalococcoidia bacterium]